MLYANKGYIKATEKSAFCVVSLMEVLELHGSLDLL